LLQRIIGVYELDVDTAEVVKEGKIKGFHSIGFSFSCSHCENEK
jgi:hypothetical protein